MVENNIIRYIRLTKYYFNINDKDTTKFFRMIQMRKSTSIIYRCLKFKHVL